MFLPFEGGDHYRVEDLRRLNGLVGVSLMEDKRSIPGLRM
jgi:hypothetical protein